MSSTFMFLFPQREDPGLQTGDESVSFSRKEGRDRGLGSTLPPSTAKSAESSFFGLLSY